jgi:hypothetical protein
MRYPQQPQQYPQQYSQQPSPMNAYAYQPQYQPQPVVQFGTVCTAQNGLAAQGQVRPLGAPCQIMTPYGAVFAGQITQ